MTIYSYKLTTDNGSAPCIQDNKLSLAICKPKIRKTAKINDYLIGISANSMNLGGNKIIYIAKITDKILLQDYYKLYSNRNDCIYNDKLCRIKNANYHSCKDILRDLSGKYVLLSSDFIFFGSRNITVPNKLKDIVPQYQGHLSRKNIKFNKILPNLFIELKNKYGNGKIGNHIHLIKTC